MCCFCLRFLLLAIRNQNQHQKKGNETVAPRKGGQTSDKKYAKETTRGPSEGIVCLPHVVSWFFLFSGQACSSFFSSGSSYSKPFSGTHFLSYLSETDISILSIQFHFMQVCFRFRSFAFAFRFRFLSTTFFAFFDNILSTRKHEFASF